MPLRSTASCRRLPSGEAGRLAITTPMPIATAATIISLRCHCWRTRSNEIGIQITPLTARSQRAMKAANRGAAAMPCGNIKSLRKHRHVRHRRPYPHADAGLSRIAARQRHRQIHAEENHGRAGRGASLRCAVHDAVSRHVGLRASHQEDGRGESRCGDRLADLPECLLGRARGGAEGGADRQRFDGRAAARKARPHPLVRLVAVSICRRRQGRTRALRESTARSASW